MTEASEFSKTLERLNEIVREVEAEDVTLDDALALYEEAVKLSLAACDVSELDILADDAPEESETAVTDAQASVAEVADGAVETIGVAETEHVDADPEGPTVR